jgi:hypothetical protein
MVNRTRDLKQFFMRCLSTILLLIWGISLSAQNNRISIGFFPEGGKLITGESCVIGFKATTAKGEPLAIRCKIVDDKKNIYGEAIALHEGRGSFEILPEEGYQYFLTCTIDSVEQSFPLPTHSAKGLALKLNPHPQGFQFEMANHAETMEEQPAAIIGEMNGRIVFRIEVPVGKPYFRGLISTASASILSGIMKVLVLNKMNKVVSERLVFVHRPIEKLQVTKIDALLIEANWYVQTTEDSAKQALDLQMLTRDFKPGLIQLLSGNAPMVMDSIKSMNEVVVRSKKKSATEEMNDFYSKGFFSSGETKIIDLVNGPDKIVHENIIEFLKFKVPGLSVVDPNYENAPMPSLDPFDDPSAYRIYYRQQATISSLGNTPMAIYLNEVQISPSVLATVPANDIVLIKVFSNFALAPGGGAGGALAIYTKKPNQKKG